MTSGSHANDPLALLLTEADGQIVRIDHRGGIDFLRIGFDWIDGE